MERQGDKGEFAQTYDNNMYDLQMFGINFTPVKIELSHWRLSKKIYHKHIRFRFLYLWSYAAISPIISI